MHGELSSKAIVKDMSFLRPADRIEVFDEDGVTWLGIVDVIAPEHGVAWMHLDAGGGRKLVDGLASSIWTWGR
jgi:hypothetical protein